METMEANSFQSFNYYRNLGVIAGLLFLAGFVFLCHPKDYFIFSYRVDELKGIDEINGLAAVLEKASQGNNKTVILAVVNQAYVDDHDNHIPAANMLDLFLESFWLGEDTRTLIKHLLIVATDPTAYERCVFRGLFCYLLMEQVEFSQMDNADSAGEKVYESKGFINMMWRRTFLLLTVLKNGYNFIFTDIDVLWLRNPLTRLNGEHAVDIQFSTDHFDGNSKSIQNPINTGFYHVRSNNRTISLFERWFSMRDKSPKKEQDVLQTLISVDGIVTELNLNAAFLETRYFSGFCEDSTDPYKVVTVHANCCRYIDAKLSDLSAVLDEWKRFKRLELNDNGALFAWSTPHVKCRDSWQQ